jgi:hypothetical protein
MTDAGWSSDWAAEHGLDPEQVYEAPNDQHDRPAFAPAASLFERHVQEKDADSELAMALCLSWQRAGRQHFLRMLVCAALSLIPMLGWLHWGAGGFGIAWIYCSYRFWTMKLT